MSPITPKPNLESFLIPILSPQMAPFHSQATRSAMMEKCLPTASPELDLIGKTGTSEK